jgi:hypothetical protein
LYARRADAHGEGGGARSDVSGFLQRLEHTGARMGWLHPAQSYSKNFSPDGLRSSSKVQADGCCVASCQ